MTQHVEVISDVAPGAVIEFADITELPLFEDQLAAEIDPEMTMREADAWAGRVAIRDLLRPTRPTNFNGRFGDIVLTPMQEPYEQLITGPQRGIAFGYKGGLGGSSAILSSEHAPLQIPRYRGFTFLANAISTGRGVVGQIQAELFYYPVSVTGAAQYKNVSNTGGASVKRVVSKPVVTDEASFVAVHKDAKRIAYSVLRNNLHNPLPKNFRN